VTAPDTRVCRFHPERGEQTTVRLFPAGHPEKAEDVLLCAACITDNGPMGCSECGPLVEVDNPMRREVRHRRGCSRGVVVTAPDNGHYPVVKATVDALLAAGWAPTTGPTAVTGEVHKRDLAAARADLATARTRLAAVARRVISWEITPSAGSLGMAACELRVLLAGDEPQPFEGPDYHAEHAAWVERFAALAAVADSTHPPP
jgi:hypothetical protein